MRPNPAAATLDASSLAACPAGGPLGEMELKVKVSDAAEPLPFANIVHLSEGDTVQYAPVMRGRDKREGEVALVLVPAKISGKDELMVTEVRDAAKPQEWRIPQTMALVVFVYGPQGLSKKKVKSFLSQDSSLVAQMADYADKTAQTEALLSALSNTESSPASMNAALTGFASQYGVAVQIDKTAPPATQAQALFAAMNPQLASYSPLAADNTTRTAQTASLATAAAGLFFGSPVGLLAGGTSMLLDLRSIAFPDTQFRSSFAQTLKNGQINLCGSRGAAPPRTRIAYVWASRIPNAPTPKLEIGDAHFIPVGQKTPVVAETSEATWKYLQRARNWALENTAANGSKQRFSVPVLKLQNQKSVEVDLTKAAVPPGVYRLAGYWDWAPFGASGTVNVLPLSSLSHAHLTPESQDKLLANGTKTPVRVTDDDFEFVSRVEVKQADDGFAVASPARFLLPKGARLGPQDHMDVQIDTEKLSPGEYQLLISQGDGKSSPVLFHVLPNAPELANLPIIINEGVAEQHYVLKGARLDALTKLEAPGVTVTLGNSGSDAGARNLTVQLQSAAKPGTGLPMEAYVKDRSEPLHFENALQITGPLPAIVSSKLSLPTGLAIKTKGNEFPAGQMLSAVLDVKNIGKASTLQLGCADDFSQPSTLRIGQQTSAYSLQQLSADQLFLSFDTGGLTSPCSMQAAIDNGKSGQSTPFVLASLVRFPQIDWLQPASAAGAGTSAPGYTLKGRNLEMINKVGWDSTSGTAVTALPAPVPGEGQAQTLAVQLPPPNANAPLYVWLRGDQDGRETTVRLAPGSAPAQPPGKPLGPSANSR